jgi:hypothetical protein
MLGYILFGYSTVVQKDLCIYKTINIPFQIQEFVREKIFIPQNINKLLIPNSIFMNYEVYTDTEENDFRIYSIYKIGGTRPEGRLASYGVLLVMSEKVEESIEIEQLNKLFLDLLTVCSQMNDSEKPELIQTDVAIPDIKMKLRDRTFLPLFCPHFAENKSNDFESALNQFLDLVINTRLSKLIYASDEIFTERGSLEKDYYSNILKQHLNTYFFYDQINMLSESKGLFKSKDDRVKKSLHNLVSGIIDSSYKTNLMLLKNQDDCIKKIAKWMT